jgi:allose kinase
MMGRLLDILVLELNPRGTIIGIYFGTGIGDAIFMNGSFYIGKNGVAGELGQIHWVWSWQR